MRTQTDRAPVPPALSEVLRAARAGSGSALERLARKRMSKSTDVRLEVASDGTVNHVGIPSAARLVPRR